MEDSAKLTNGTKQPKKRFVGRRAADAQGQKDAQTQGNTETGAVKRGKHSSYDLWINANMIL